MKLSRPFYFFSATSAMALVVGDLLNRFVQHVNNGFMPVTLKRVCESGEPLDFVHVCAGATTHLNILGDWIHSGLLIMSPGDLILFNVVENAAYLAAAALAVRLLYYGVEFLTRK